MKKAVSLLAPYRGLRKEIYIIVSAKTINAMGTLIHPFLTLLLSRKIGLSAGDTGFYIAMCSILWAPASLIGGKLSDIIGRKPVLILFESLASLGYVACLFITPGMAMVYLIMFNTFCFGAAGPSHDAMMADLSEPAQREGAYSLGYLGYNFGFAIAQVLAGFLFEIHLPLMFLIDALTAAIAIIMIGLLVPETRNEALRKEEMDADDETAPSDKSIFHVLWERPLLIIFALVCFGYRFLYSCWHFLIPLHAEFRFPQSGAALFGLLGSFNALIVVIFTPLLTYFLRNRTSIRKIFYGGALFTLGFGLLGFIDFRAAFFLSVFIFTLGEISEAVSLMPFLMSHTPSTHRGRMSSVLPIIMGSGFVAGPIVLGSYLEKTSFRATWHLAALVGLAATIGMGLIDLYERKKGTGYSRDSRKRSISP